MRVSVREYRWYKDLFFQCQILFDDSIQRFMFDNKRKLIRYILPSKDVIKFVAIREQNGKKKRIGIAQFTKGHISDSWWIAGFIPTRLQNKGLGVYVGTASINELFKRYPNCTIFSGSFSFNYRAVRTTTSLGFKTYLQDEQHFESSLTKKQFDNEFVRFVKKRCNML